MLDTNLIIDRIVNRRKALGWSQRQLAVNSGVSFEYVNKIESKHHFPSLPMLERMAEVLGMTERDLFFGADANGNLYLISEINGYYKSLDKQTKVLMRNTLDSMDEIDKALKRNRARFS